MRRLLVMLYALAFAGTASPAVARDADAAPIAMHVVDGDFDLVLEAVELAITDRGLVIDHRSHIGDMLARTGKDLGARKQVYAKAETMQFCSASLSRRTMEADPRNIAFCPYIVFVYTLPDAPKKVHVGYRRPPQVGTPASREALQEVEMLLEGIVQEALSW